MGKSLSENDFDQIESWIGTGPKTFDLLYNITRDGCKADVFHQKCDNQGPTLTVLFNKEGSVYGGYTGVSWLSSQGFQMDNTAFLHQLYFSGNRVQHKFSLLKSGQTATCSLPTFGPIFGSSSKTDLYTYNGEIQRSPSGEYTLNGDMDSSFGKTYDTGGTSSKDVNNGHIRVTELVVYAVKDGQRNKSPLPTPWRKTAELGPKMLESLKEEVKGIKPPEGLDVPDFNILLLGPISSGKSSFCNLVTSVFRGRISHRASVGGNPETSTTTMFTPYTVGDKACLKVYDMKGVAEMDALDLLQCNFILDGNVPDFYELTPTSLISTDDPDFRRNPTLSNKIHCVVFVLDGSTLGDVSTPLLNKLMAYRNLLSRKEIPQAVLVTKIDKLCGKTAENISNTFLSPAVKEVVDKAADLLKLPRNSILPVKNYEEEMESDENINIIALLAVRQILFFAEDYLENMKTRQSIRGAGRTRNSQVEGEVFGSDTT